MAQGTNLKRLWADLEWRKRQISAIKAYRTGKSLIELYGVEKAAKIIEKQRIAHLGQSHPHTIESKRKISEALLGSHNAWWKGDDVGLSALHIYMRKHVSKPDKCRSCSERPPRDLANISQQYKRDISDWEWLCRRCHMEKDGRIHKLKTIGKHKLDIILVKEIRSMANRMKQNEIALQYGIQQSQVSRIINYKRWKNV